MTLEAAWKRVNVLGVEIAAIDTQELLDTVVTVGAGPDRDNPFFLTYLNAACSNLAADDPEYKSILEMASCVYADGQSIVWTSALTGRRLPERVNAGDFILEFLSAAASRAIRLALVGGRAGVAERAAEAWMQLIPGLQIVVCNDGYFTDSNAVVQKVALANPDIVLVGLGVPRQEKWAWENRRDLNTKVIWCVGALLEYYGDGRKRAPNWMRRTGLEWVYRLAQEPRRLWHRYLIGNPRFMFRALLFR